jgi:hypothetical protein
MKKYTSSLSVARGSQKKPGIAPTKPVTTAARFDALQESGENVDEYLALEQATRPGRQRVNVDFPIDLLRAIDREAQRIGVTRQAFIKLRLADVVSVKVVEPS